MSTLPAPTRTRWQPLRTGLVDLFHYDAEEFWFRDGRLLLRGNNGTGKSKVLALTLPFLLDGDMRAHRVEPDADPKKRMDWNLLLGGEHPHPERLGYTWIEFGRRDEQGVTHYRTLGCGLKAVSGRGIARHWFFVTDQRIGEPDGGLSLLDATGATLGRDRLAEAVEGHGMVYDRAVAYRRAVDEALFGLGEQRYAALVDLLIQLRQPQLSKRPDERKLSRALTEALPPMDQRIVADVAEAFRSLDDEKSHLTAMEEAQRAAEKFLRHYTRYARAAARRAAQVPREKHSRYEHVQRELNDARASRDRAREDVAAAETELAVLEERDTRLRADDEALRASPEMRSAHELDRAEQEASRTAEAARTAAVDQEDAQAARARAAGRLASAENRLAAAREQVAQALAEALRDADGAGFGAEFDRDVAAPLRNVAAADSGPGPDVAARRRAGEELADRRTRAAGHVQDLLAAADAVGVRRLAAVRRLEEADSELGTAAERHTEAEGATDTAAAELVSSVRSGLDAARELTVGDPVGLLDRLQEWTGHLEGPSPARAAAEEGHRQAAAALADGAAALRGERRALSAQETELRTELAQLEAGGQLGPRPPHTRGEGVRSGVPGAPLWRLVDYRADLPSAERAGLEAALEASGLLDAWVHPDGTALRPDCHDVLLTTRAPVTGPSLADVLRPAVDHGDPQATAVQDDVLRRLLASVGYGEQDDAHTWVDGDGRFVLGALRGAWAKPTAEYLGEGAREEARRSRIAELETHIDETVAALDAADRTLGALEKRRSVLDGERDAVAGDETALRRAYTLLSAAADGERRARDKRENCAEEAEGSAREAAEAEEATRSAAEELRLPADRAALGEVRETLARYRATLAGLWPAVRERTDAGHSVAVESEEARRADGAWTAMAQRAEDATRDATTADQRRTTLRSTVGAAVDELQRRLTEVRDTLRACATDQRTARESREKAVKAESRALGRGEQLEEDVEEAVRERGEAVATLQRFASTGLLAVALPELALPAGDGPWAPTAAVELARTVDRELSDTDHSDGAWERVQKKVSEEFKGLQDALARHGHTASGQLLDDGMVVEVVFQGRPRAVPELAEALTEEVDNLRRILSAREREILETHLLTEVGGTLQELIGAAERQVRDMNTELAERPTSTGMRLRLVWRPSRSAPDGLGPARERLRQSADAWSGDDRAAVGEFLQAQIARVQSDDPTAGWLEQLTTALDYRNWHEFGIERRQNGQWRSATGPASGGERVLSVSVPLFAAASSHYRTAGSPYAPRLVTLDEAFAGVDDDSRAKCLGLLSSFDLDVVMTSEREWACYPEVPGVAIAQLSRVDGVDAVLVTRWEWDGERRSRGAGPGTEPGSDSAPRTTAVMPGPREGSGDMP